VSLTRPLQKNLFNLSELTAGQEPHMPFTLRPREHSFSQIFFEILGNTCGEGTLRPCNGPCTGALARLRRPCVCYITKAGDASQLYRRDLHFSALHGASFFGIVELVTLFTNAEGCEINQQDCTGKLIHHLRGRQEMDMQEWRNYY